MNLATATPCEIDTQLERLYHAEAQAERTLQARLDTLHRGNGERMSYSGRREFWARPDDETIAQCQADADRPLRGYPGKTLADALGSYRAAELALQEVRAEARPYHQEYGRRPWPRYFKATSHNGHIHKSLTCKTCNRRGSRTSFDWNVELSGLPVDEAIAALQTTMCTVCFPAAPAAERPHAPVVALRPQLEQQHAQQDQPAVPAIPPAVPQPPDDRAAQARTALVDAGQVTVELSDEQVLQLFTRLQSAVPVYREHLDPYLASHLVLRAGLCNGQVDNRCPAHPGFLTAQTALGALAETVRAARYAYVQDTFAEESAALDAAGGDDPTVRSVLEIAGAHDAEPQGGVQVADPSGLLELIDVYAIALASLQLAEQGIGDGQRVQVRRSNVALARSSVLQVLGLGDPGGRPGPVPGQRDPDAGGVSR